MRVKKAASLQPSQRMRRQSSVMAVSRYIAFSLLCLCALSADSVDEKHPPFSFSFENFGKGRSFESQIGLYGDAEVSDSAAVRSLGKGRVLFKKPIRFFGTDPGFSTYLAFAISRGIGGGLAFMLVPNNASQISPRFLAVKFDADSSGGSIAIDVGGQISVKSSNLSADGNLALDGDEKLHSWIDYDGVSKVIEVRVSKSRDFKPENSSVSCPVDLSNVLRREAMYVGISSSSGKFAQTITVYSWSFGVTNGAPYRMHSDPLDPESVSVRSHEDPPVHVRRSSPWKIVVALFVGAVCGALAASAVFFLRSKIVERHPIAPVEYPVIHVESGFEKIVLDGKKFEGNAAKQNV